YDPEQQELLDLLSRENDALRRQTEELGRQKVELEERDLNLEIRIQELTDENQRLSENFRLVRQHATPSVGSPIAAVAPPPTTVLAALNAAELSFASTLRIWESAKVAAESSTFRDPEAVFDALQSISS